MARKPFTTTLDEDIMYEASMQAAKEKCKVNDIIEKSLTEYLASHKKKDAH